MNSGPSKLAKQWAELRHANHIANQAIAELRTQLNKANANLSITLGTLENERKEHEALRLNMGFKQNTIERLQHELQLYRSAKP